MSNGYYLSQRDKQQALIGSDVFRNDNGNGKFMGKNYPFVLAKGENNLFPPVNEVERYFSDNHISWWGGYSPTGHILSSQMACLNHLFPIMNDKDSVLAILNGVRDNFKEVLPIRCDKNPQYIAFEVVSSADHLNEEASTRGSNCTSVDALILAVDKNDKVWLIPIEWKYTEHYGTEDKSAGNKGETRKARYNQLITDSKQLKTLPDFKIYYQEPFYQLMRQTLWSEQVVLHKDMEMLKADDYLHIHVIPDTNVALLRNDHRYPYKVSGLGMEDTWRYCLTDQSKYEIIDPKKLLSPIMSKYPELAEYLETRYW